MECLGNFDGIVLSLACILAKQLTVHGGKYFLKTPGNAISKTLNFKMSQDASALKNLCLWWKFQSHLLQSTLALRTPRYNGHPDKTDSS